MENKILEFISAKEFYGPIFTIIGAILLYKVILTIINNSEIKGKTELDKKRRQTIVILFSNILKYIILTIAILVILNIYNINTSSLIAGLGIAGIVVGLALQDALKDIIGGINIIMDNYFIIGDIVKYKEFTGTVISLGLKTSKIKSSAGEVLIVANRNIDSIINLSQKKSVLILNIPTAHECDNKKVRKVLESIINKVQKYDYVSEKECQYLGIDQITENIIIYAFKIKCEQGKEFDLKREILEMVKEEYAKHSLKIPYKQIEVHHGQDL